VRLPPATHGNGDNGFIPTAIGFARDKGAAAYVGDGTNRWPSVHRDDAARLFGLALESAPAGSVLHAVGDEGVPIREIAEIVAKHLDIPAASVTAEQIGEYVGFLGGFWGFDGPASAQITRDLLGWEPTRPGLIADLEEATTSPKAPDDNPVMPTLAIAYKCSARVFRGRGLLGSRGAVPRD